MVDEMFDGMDVSDSMAMGAAMHEDVANNGAIMPGAGKFKNPAQSLLNELTSNDRTVHSTFQNNFGTDLFDDDDLE